MPEEDSILPLDQNTGEETPALQRAEAKLTPSESDELTPRTLLYCLIDVATSQATKVDQKQKGEILAENYQDAIRQLTPTDRERVEEFETILIASRGHVPEPDEIQSILTSIQNQERGFLEWWQGRIPRFTLVPDPSEDLISEVESWYSEANQESHEGGHLEDREERHEEKQRSKHKELESETLPAKRLRPRESISELKKAVQRLDKQQQSDRERLERMLETLMGDPSWTGEERHQFVHSLNDVLDRLGIALFLPDSEDPVRLGVKTNRGNTYFRLTRNGRSMGGSAGLWKFSLKRKPPSKLRK